MARRSVLGALAGSALLLSGCGLFDSSASFRYRLVVEGDVSASAVYEIRATQVNGPRLPEEKLGGSIIIGEALVIEAADGPVFLLLKSAQEGGDFKSSLVRALAPDIPWNGQPNFFRAVNRLSGEAGVKAELPRTDWPVMVQFRDLNDPKSVAKVSPDAVGVKRIWVETTRDAVTSGIEKWLRWLSGAENFQYAGVPYGELYPLPASAFRSGVK